MNSETNGIEDEDCVFLEKVLDKLYDFGNKPATKKKSKKKKRKRCEEDDPGNAFSDDNGADHQHQQSTPEQTDQLIQQKNQAEVVIFQDPRKKLKTKQTPTPENTLPLQTKEKQKEQPEELSLEKARLEVHRFGITGYKKEEQRVFEQDRAVMLGARPPKKQYVNYKVLQQHLKEKKHKEKEEVHPDMKRKKKQNNPRDKRKATPSGPGSGSAPSGQVGRFKNGMLILSSKEIQKIKGSKRGR